MRCIVPVSRNRIVGELCFLKNWIRRCLARRRPYRFAAEEAMLLYEEKERYN